MTASQFPEDLWKLFVLQVDWAAMWKIWIWAQKHALQSNYTWWSSIIVRPRIQCMHVKWKRKNDRSLLRWLRGSKRKMLKFQHVKWINQWYSVRDCGLVSKNKGNESTWSQNYEIRQIFPLHWFSNIVSYIIWLILFESWMFDKEKNQN